MIYEQYHPIIDGHNSIYILYPRARFKSIKADYLCDQHKYKHM